jgi:DUF4097 and DUF4098 domain-containing protein YvlB
MRREEMSKRTWLGSMILLAAIACFAGPAAFAQRERPESDAKELTCNDNGGRGRPQSCVIREQTIPAGGGAITVDGKKNGGISVKGWDRGEIFVRSKVQTWGDTDAEAQALIGLIHIETGGGQIHAEGPSTSGERGWSVSFEVFVPRNSNLTLKTHNGGVSIADVRGQIEFNALNGGVTLRRLAGSVKGHTVNGGLSIELAGNRWDGDGLNVKTTNGGVSMTIPENYSARLETSTVNGGLKIDFPITLQGKIDREISADLGSGGTTIRATTTNGGVTVRRKA